MSSQNQQDLLVFMPDPIKNLNPVQLNNYNFLQNKLRQFKTLRRIATDKKSVDNVIEAYKSEIKKLLEGC